MDYNKRKSERFISPGTTITLSDGDKATECIVENVSKKGILVSDIPKSFNYHNKAWVGTVSLDLWTDKLYLTVKRKKMGDKDKPYMSIGFSISLVTLEWVDYVESLGDGDVWGN